MLPIRTILYPTDFSERSKCAFPLACALARDYGAKLVVLHVVTPPVIVYGEGILPDDTLCYKKEAQGLLERLEVPGGKVNVERLMVEGDPVTEVLRAAKETKCDVVVMGTHGWTGVARFLMGSVAEQLVRKAPCPVLTVKAPFPEAVETAEHVEAEPVAANV